jgi:hypothetical protein
MMTMTSRSILTNPSIWHRSRPNRRRNLAFSCGELGTLEPRIVLSDSSGLLARIDRIFVDHVPDRFTINVNPTDFSTPRGRVLLSLATVGMADGGDPSRLRLKPVGGGAPSFGGGDFALFEHDRGEGPLSTL